MTTLTLLEVTERLRHNLTCVRQAAEPTVKRSHPGQTAGPFTNAILSNKPLITYLRDAVPGEARLLTVHTGGEAVDRGGSGTGVQQNGSTTPQDDALPEVATLDRRQIVSATPLRRRKEVGPSGESGDLFLKSALKLIDRYNVMPEKRETIIVMLERYYDLEPKIKELQKTVARLSEEIPANQQQHTDDYMSAKQAELAVRQMEGKVAEARAKRDALKLRVQQLQNPGGTVSKTQKAPVSASSADTSLMSATDTMTSPLMDQTIPSGLNFGNNLFSSIMRAPEASSDVDEQEFWTGKRLPMTSLSLVPPASEADESTATEGKTQETEMEMEDDGDDDDDGDTTVLLSFAPHEGHSIVESPERPLPTRTIPIIPPAPPPVVRARSQTPPPSKRPDRPPVHQMPKVTHAAQFTKADEQTWSPSLEVEEIVQKLWVTVGEVVLPGHKYDIGLGKEDGTPPRALETISILRSQTIAPNTTSNTSLTARLLLTLLTSPPADASSGAPAPVSMASLKVTVDTLAGERGFGKDLGAKTVYSCVAKKLLKIDRRSKEPTVAFDI